jgi:hypothetical protein
MGRIIEGAAGPTLNFDQKSAAWQPPFKALERRV